MTDTTSLPEEFVLLQRELSRLTARRFSRGKVFPLAGALCLAVLALMCGYRSLSAIHRFGDTHPAPGSVFTSHPTLKSNCLQTKTIDNFRAVP